MSGHSKWANIKHKKGKADAARGALFTKVSREIIIAARQGGPNPDGNFRLKMAILKARSVNMPNDSIQRAIKRATGDGEETNYDEVVYEGYGAGGVAIMVEAMTDNRNRTAAELRYLFSRNGGNLGESGCVAWMFDRKGVLTVNMSELGMDEDEAMLTVLDAGAEDFKVEDGVAEIITSVEEMDSVRVALEENGFKFQSGELSMLPKNTVEVTGKEARQVLNLIDVLEENDDVQNIYSNFSISDEEMEAIENS